MLSTVVRLAAAVLSRRSEKLLQLHRMRLARVQVASRSVGDQRLVVCLVAQDQWLEMRTCPRFSRMLVRDVSSILVDARRECSRNYFFPLGSLPTRPQIWLNPRT